MDKFTDIKQQQLQSRKDKNEVKTALLTTLIGEISMVAKNDGNRQVTDMDVQALVKKFLKGVDETISILARRGDDLTSFITEREILMSFMPQQMTEEALKTTIQSIVAKNQLQGAKSMGLIMKELKAQFDGQYDSTMASKISKEILA